jgi:Ferritin-like domain
MSLPSVHRRRLIQGMALTLAGTGLALPASADTPLPTASDMDIFNLTLNLDYLQAEFYVRASTGQGLTSDLTGGTGNQGTVTGGSKVPFRQSLVAGIAQRFAEDEVGHVMFLRQTLGSAAVAEPDIDLQTSFTNVAVAAGLIQQGETFDPFADDLSFLIGAYIFEDVGVTAIAGATPLFSTASVGFAARILGTEGYHAGTIRAELSQRRQGSVTDAISALRQKLSGVSDFGTDAQGSEFNITNVDNQGLCFARTAGEVLVIAYGGGTNGGLFFPNGVNGVINTAS